MNAPMDAERWKRVDDLLQSALQEPADQQDEFLRQECAGDPALLEEVQSLLTSHRRAGRFLEQPAIHSAAQAVASDASPPAAAHSFAGQTVSHYRVLGQLGSGGMGVVYKAEDVKLGRQVALKFLPGELASDRTSLERLQREARAASMLDHPNICSIHELGEHEGQPFIVMQLLEGETLREWIESASRQDQSTRLSRSLDLAIQIAEGLEAAHQKGIIHRDIKPANIFITTRGEAKILDFGLAKALKDQPEAEGAREAMITDATTTPDLAKLHLTRTGTTVGTAYYMSPEQVLGKELDTRTDLFSFGLVLYEMVTAQRAFAGETGAAVYEAILSRTPTPVRQLNPAVPEELEEIIQKAVEKDRNSRYQSAQELARDLKSLRKDFRPQTAGGKRKKRLAVAAAALVVFATAGAFYYRRHHAAPLTDKDVIVLADFTNTTGDAVFDDTLKQGLSVQLEQSPFLDLISDRKVNDTLKLMGHAAGERLTPELARDVCLRTGGKALLTGSIASLGSQYVIGLTAVNCETGDVLAKTQEQAAGKEGVLKSLDAAAVSLRSQLGESLSTVQRYSTPLMEATTPSLEALKAYSLGWKMWSTKGGTDALPFLNQAIKLDPNFAAAYDALEIVYSNLNETGQAEEFSRKAYALRAKVSERERFEIEANYEGTVTGDLEKMEQLIGQWQQNYPRDKKPYIYLPYVSAALGNRDLSLERAREAQRLEPDRTDSYDNLGNSYAVLNRMDEAEAVYAEADRRNLGGELLLGNRYELFFLRADPVQMAQVVAAGMGKPGTEDLLLAKQADTDAWYGRVKDAREFTRKAMESAEHNGARESAAIYEAAAALREVEWGYPERASADVAAAMKLGPDHDVRNMAALALARAGDLAGAEKLAAELDETYPEDTLVQKYWLPSIRAAVALQRNDPSQAVEQLKSASTIETGQTVVFAVYLCPVYLRGQAYLRLHDGSRAAAEFQKFIDDRGLVGNFQWGVLARLNLARAYVMAGDNAKAKTAYQEFLTIWKDADPDVPILKQAQAEYAKL